MTRSSLIAALAVGVFALGCGGSSGPEQQSAPAPAAERPSAGGPATAPPDSAEEKLMGPERPAFTRTDIQTGTGAPAQKGKRLGVHYTGWLYDPTKPDLKGRMFDTSRDRGPFDFVLGAGQVIPGWDQGFDGMRVGGRRRLTIPPDLAYGDEGAGDGIIPPKSTLIFEMELLEVQP